MKHKVVCIGAMLVDELFFCKEPVVAGTSNPAYIKRTAGGVMRNIVQHLQLLEIPVQFITVVGNDADGEWLKKECELIGINTGTTITANCSTGKYAAILQPDGNLYTAVAVNPAEAYLSVAVLQEYIEVLNSASIINDSRFHFERFFVRTTTIWLDVLEIFAKNESNLIPVLDDKNTYLGYYELEDIIRFFHETPFLKEEGGIIVVEKESDKFSMSQVAQDRKSVV